MNYLYNQQTKLSNCFILSNYVMNLDLSATALAIYCYLMYIEDRKNYECYPSYKTIGKALKIDSMSRLQQKCRRYWKIKNTAMEIHPRKEITVAPDRNTVSNKK